MKKVLLAFSGGNDSCQSALDLMDEGYDVTGMLLLTTDTYPVDQARSNASNIGIPLEVVDVRNQFRETVIDSFLSSYLNGQTPSPCSICNSRIKWRYLDELSAHYGMEHIATGHYVRTGFFNGNACFRKGVDTAKDQSYFLWEVPPRIISKALLPMGGKIKKEILGSIHHTLRSRESMGICFLEGMQFDSFIRKHLTDKTRRGMIIDSQGNSIGHHDGTPFYTIGQKKGTGLPKDMCITGIDAANNVLVAGSDDELYKHTLIIEECGSLDTSADLTHLVTEVKIRGIGKNPGKIKRIEPHGRGLEISLADPAWAPALGQPVVLYHIDLLLGGGILKDYF